MLLQKISKAALVNVPQLKQDVPAILLNGSPSAASLGQMVAAGFHSKLQPEFAHAGACVELLKCTPLCFRKQ